MNTRVLLGGRVTWCRQRSRSATDEGACHGKDTRSRTKPPPAPILGTTRIPMESKTASLSIWAEPHVKNMFFWKPIAILYARMKALVPRSSGLIGSEVVRPGEVCKFGGGRTNSASILESIAPIDEFPIRYIRDVGKFQQHYPNWHLPKSLARILEDMVKPEAS